MNPMNPWSEEGAADIAQQWLSDLKSERQDTATCKTFARQLLASRLVQQMKPEKGLVLQMQNQDVQAGLQKAEDKMGRALNGSVDSTPDDDDDEIHGSQSQYPNLKYKKPKYQNVESILRYVEGDEKSSGGVRLVFMNFND